MSPASDSKRLLEESLRGRGQACLHRRRVSPRRPFWASGAGADMRGLYSERRDVASSRAYHCPEEALEQAAFSAGKALSARRTAKRSWTGWFSRTSTYWLKDTAEYGLEWWTRSARRQVTEEIMNWRSESIVLAAALTMSIRCGRAGKADKKETVPAKAGSEEQEKEKESEEERSKLFQLENRRHRRGRIARGTSRSPTWTVVKTRALSHGASGRPSIRPWSASRASISNGCRRSGRRSTTTRSRSGAWARGGSRCAATGGSSTRRGPRAATSSTGR